jgi:aminodeoxyfutalosine deaminase
MTIQSYLHAAPKAELHVHLEGAILPAHLLELARRNRVALPYDTEEGLRQWFVYRDFPHFVDIYVTITTCFKHAEDYEFIAYEFGREMARQNVRYAEVTFSPSTHYQLGVPFDVMFGGLSRGRNRARIDYGVEFNWVFDIVRDGSGRPHADWVVDRAIEGMRDGVVSLGLGGIEVGNPPEDFVPYFDRAIAAGLHSNPHAGEHGGPDSVWGAIQALHAERIGHGVRSIEDPALVAYLAEHRIPIEVNPTSNIRLGVFPGYEAHPLRRLYEAGVPLTVNSDDPPLFNTTMDEEVRLLDEAFHFDIAQIDDILLNGIRHSFIESDRKARLEAAWRAELDTLKREHLNTDAG